MNPPNDSDETSARRLLRPEEKRAPIVVPWRPDARETISGIAIVVVACLASVWLLWSFVLRSDDIRWRNDGVIVEVRRDLGDRPRPDVTTVPRGDESYAWAYPPLNIGGGGCRDPRFRLDGMPERGRVYRAGETLSIEVVYNAPRCINMYVVFEGRFIKGSPWYKQSCEQFPVEHQNKLCRDYFVGTIISSTRSLSGAEGAVELIANPGLERPVDPSSPGLSAVPFPTSIEGFRLCSITINVGGGPPNDSRSTQEVHIDCHSSFDDP